MTIYLRSLFVAGVIILNLASVKALQVINKQNDTLAIEAACSDSVVGLVLNNSLISRQKYLSCVAISDRFVITAAHGLAGRLFVAGEISCFTAGLTVTFDPLASESSKFYQVKRFIVHPLYQEKKLPNGRGMDLNDIAILELSDPIEGIQKFPDIGINKVNADPNLVTDLALNKCHVVGYGPVENQSERMLVRREGRLECGFYKESYHQFPETLTPGYMYAPVVESTVNTDPLLCYLVPGDSGGPLFNDRNELVGIVSGGIGYGLFEKPKPWENFCCFTPLIRPDGLVDPEIAVMLTQLESIDDCLEGKKASFSPGYIPSEIDFFNMLILASKAVAYS